MRQLALVLIAAPMFAAVDGTVLNQTTGKPQPNVIVSLVQPGQGGMQTLGSVRTDAQGKFKVDKNAQGPVLIQAMFAGVQYNQMLTPGSPMSGVEVHVFDATDKPGTVQVNQHMFLLQPNDQGIAVSETLLVRNDTQTTYSNPGKGDLDFYLPPTADGKVQVTVSAPGGMPVQREAEKTAAKDVYKVNYPIKPGETRFDLAYAIVQSGNARTFASKVLNKEGATRLVVPNGVQIEGDGLKAIGQEPTTQANIYDVSGDSFSVKLQGSGSIASSGGAADASGGSGSAEDNGEPQVTEARPFIYSNMYLILGLSFAILGLGFVLLYRHTPAGAQPKGKKRG